jgi:hypothetical protein
MVVMIPMKSIQTVDNIKISDRGSWPPKLTDSLRVSIVKQGPAKPDPIYEYPKDEMNRRFTVANT